MFIAVSSTYLGGNVSFRQSEKFLTKLEGITHIHSGFLLATGDSSNTTEEPGVKIHNVVGSQP